jgi:uncharacterized phage protein (TIGR01671 family)
MIRELKFRAWDFDNKKWIMDFLFSKKGTICIWDRSEIKFEYISDNIQILQFTGLDDKNGNPIYEGDILKHEWTNDIDFGLLGQEQKMVSHYEVYWAIGHGGFAITGIERSLSQKNYPPSMSETYFGPILVSQTEIIGNKFEHPELLKSI